MHNKYFCTRNKARVSTNVKEDIENAGQNPIASMYVLPFQNNTQFGIGAQNITQLNLLFIIIILLAYS